MDRVIQDRKKGKVCLECGSRVVGRSDKRYCSDFCRNSWNNRRNRDFNTEMRRGNSRLRQNYRILTGLLGNRPTRRIAVADLIGMGFDFNWYTRVLWKGQDRPLHIVYTLGYRKLSDGHCLLFALPFSSSGRLPAPISSYGN